MAKVQSAERWGAALGELRHAARLSAAEVVKRLKTFGIHIDRASIYTYEAGRVSAPDAGVVWGLAQVYGVSVAELIGTLVSIRNGGQSTERARVSPRTTAAKPNLAEDESDLIKVWRRLSPHRRKVCREFILFELNDGISGPQRGRAERMNRTK
jgi:transcriptional regulator with XRE-family HTH domain